MPSRTDDLTATSRRELYELARRRGVPRRSRMNADELREALRDGPRDLGDGRPVALRADSFRALARDRAEGRMVMLPRNLSRNDRRLHVRQTLREDHQSRIAGRSVDAEAKFQKLADSLFAFFRGTCLLFYRDMAGEDARMPTVLTLGDVHPGNFGVMPSSDEVPIFGANDFDEAYYAPFTWDIKRGAVGFMVAAREKGGHGAGRARKIARRFVRGYIDAIATYAHEQTERAHQVRADNAPPLVRDLIDDARQDRAEWLEDDYYDEFRRGFRSDDELVPVSSRRDDFQELLDRFVRENGISPPSRAGDMRVKDVAIRRGQGTASLGLERYYLMIEGPDPAASDDLILELKQARQSALAGLVPPSDYGVDGQGGRITHAHGVQLVGGDVFYGDVEWRGLSFMVRERAPFRDDIDLDDLSSSEWREYAAICGGALAHSHALSDDAGAVDHDVEPEIVDAIGAHALFVDDVLRFADEAVDRLRADHEHFRADHALGAFRRVDVVYR